jgi:hypothetical protein
MAMGLLNVLDDAGAISFGAVLVVGYRRRSSEESSSVSGRSYFSTERVRKGLGGGTNWGLLIAGTGDGDVDNWDAASSSTEVSGMVSSKSNSSSISVRSLNAYRPWRWLDQRLVFACREWYRRGCGRGGLDRLVAPGT